MNRLFLLLFGMVTFVAHAQVPDYVPTDGLNVWYDFNSNLIDGSGNSNDAQNHSATFGPDRWGNELFAVDFTGPAQWVETSPWLTGIQNNFTLSIWFNLRSFEAHDGPFANIFHHRAHWKDKVLTTGVHPSTGESLGESIKYGDRQFSGTNYLDLFSQAIELNVWNHVVVSGDNLNFFLFVNGELIDQAPRTFDSDWSGSFYGAYLGANGYQSESTMNGMVDEFGAWSRTLSTLEIQGLYAAGAPVFGCTDELACNFNPEANVDDSSCIPSGCMDSQACNFNLEAECEGQSCEYTCCPGPGCCLEGTVWDAELGGCIPLDTSCPHDLDFDGVVGVNDLMELLSAFGTDCPEPEGPATSEFTCGDPVSYHGYDYATVQIGEQCWFAENLRTELYQNGDSIPGNLSDDEWVEASNSMNGAQAFFDNNESHLVLYGRLFNQYAVDDDRGLCPTEWHVPSDEEFMTLELILGMNEDEVNMVGWRGTDQGVQLKSSPDDVPSWDGTNTSGFSAVIGGNRWSNGGGFHDLETTGYLWTSSLNWSRRLFSGVSGISRYSKNAGYGFSVRCLKD